MSEKKKILSMPLKKDRTAEVRAAHRRRKDNANPADVARFRATLGTCVDHDKEESNG